MAITKYTAKTIKKAIADEDFDYQYTTLISDKLRAIYTLFGWTHMLDEFHAAQNNIDQLLMKVYEQIAGGKMSVQVSCAGLMIESWIDEDGYVNLDYYFNLS